MEKDDEKRKELGIPVPDAKTLAEKKEKEEKEKKPVRPMKRKLPEGR